MKPKFSISIEEARKIILTAQGLCNQREQPAPLEIIENLGYIQIDTISVVERTHHHTFFTRCPAYCHTDLDFMLEESREVFEYWSHAASYLPMKEFRFSLFTKNEFKNGKKHWYEKDKNVMRRVIKRIREEGPLQSKDFEDSPDRPRNVWSSKPAKRALEQLFMEGSLMTTKRQGFQKVYDLAERVLPSSVDTKVPTKKQFCRYLVISALNAQGMASEKEISYLRKGIQPTLGKVLKEMISEGTVLPVEIQGQDKIYYMTEIQQSRILGDFATPQLFLLSPFDNLVIQRDRMKSLFDFEYLLECYVPEAKRKFGYFCLPILYGNNFAGRLDAKADRKAKVFYVKSIWLEAIFNIDELFVEALAKKIIAYAEFCGTSSVQVLKTSPGKLKSILTRSIKKYS